MLIIDLNSNRVQNSRIDLDVIVIKGASPALVKSLSMLTLTHPNKIAELPPMVDAPKSNKVPLANLPYVEKVSHAVPTSIKACSSSSFEEVFNKLSDKLDNTLKSSCCAKPCTPKATKPTVSKVQPLLAPEDWGWVLGDDKFIESLRLAIQNNKTLNDDQNTLTTANIKTALALYLMYGLEGSFSAADGVASTSEQVESSTGIIQRLASAFSILRRTGQSTATRYRVNNLFGVLYTRTLYLGRFEYLRDNMGYAE